MEIEDADPGLGLGLNTVAEIAAQHGGRVWVEDRVGGGASFHLLLPTAAAERMQRPAGTPDDTRTPIHVGQQMVRVLVIDDDPNMMALLKMALGGEGFDVDVAMTGETGLDRAMNGAPDLIVLDAALPDIDGRELSKRIRSNPAGADVPIVMFTNLADPRHETAAIRAGVNGFVAKTRGVDKLIRELRRLIAVTETVGPPRPSIEDEVNR
jgi:CheY-like chemotaxis protein